MNKLIEVPIDKDIPIPGYTTRPKHIVGRQKREYSYPYEKMKIGDSFFSKSALALQGNSRALRTGFLFTRRKVQDGYRIWRIK